MAYYPTFTRPLLRRPLEPKLAASFLNSSLSCFLDKVVPFLVEDMLKAAGGLYSKGGDWQSHVVTDGLLVTGQNPASSGAGAQALLQVLQATSAHAAR